MSKTIVTPFGTHLTASMTTRDCFITCYKNSRKYGHIGGDVVMRPQRRGTRWDNTAVIIEMREDKKQNMRFRLAPAWYDTACCDCGESLPKGELAIEHTTVNDLAREGRYQCRDCACTRPPNLIVFRRASDVEAPKPAPQPAPQPAPLPWAPKAETEEKETEEKKAEEKETKPKTLARFLDPEGAVIAERENASKALAAIAIRYSLGHRNVWLAGPAGTGKTYTASEVATLLDRDFLALACSEDTSKADLFGGILPQADGTWSYERSDFVNRFESGDVILLDECDALPSNLGVALNAALANGYIDLPRGGGRVERHPDTLVICAANTWGTGATAEYTGRNKLDAATLDRFVGAEIHVDYDEELERRISVDLCGQDWPAMVVQAWRAKAREAGLQRVVSMRMTQAFARAVKCGLPEAEIVDMLLTSWTADDRAMVTT